MSHKAQYTDNSLALSVFDVQSHDTADLLTPDQAEKFSDGLPAFYEHVMSLLDRHKANKHTAEFAKLALEAHGKDMDQAEKNVGIMHFTDRALIDANTK